VCRRSARSGNLLRLRLDGAGSLVLGRGPGRGAWVCANEECVANLEQWQLGRALRGDVAAEDLAASKSLLRDAVRAGVRD